MGLTHRQNATRNKYTILETIRRNGGISRRDIAKLTILSPTTITKFTEELIKESLIRERGTIPSSGGRKPIKLKINPNSAYTIGVDIGSANLRVLLVDLKGKILLQREETHSQEGKEVILNKAKKMIRHLIKESAFPFQKIKGIGIGISGVVNYKEGICLLCHHRCGWENTNLKEFFEEEFNLPTLVDDSSRTAAIAVKNYELDNKIKNFIYLGIGIGVGSGIFIDGRLYRGTKGLAGEIGHTTVDENGPRCSCGNRGCLESLVSASAITERAKKLLEEGVNSQLTGKVVTPKRIAQAAKEEDKLALNIVAETGRYLGIGIANAINIFDPQMVILGGGIGQMGELLLPAVQETVKLRALQATARGVDIKFTQLGNEVAALGSATLVLDNLFHTSLVYL